MQRIEELYQSKGYIQSKKDGYWIDPNKPSYANQGQ
jgi:hypothetical protein